MIRFADLDRVGAHLDGQSHLADHIVGVRAGNASARDLAVAVGSKAVVEHSNNSCIDYKQGMRSGTRKLHVSQHFQDVRLGLGLLWHGRVHCPV